ncbi:peroxisomal carnitine O-octanoyltransferase-like [Frieseomelitta varia]|uniref:peroxisomal carnitine O-octanoyltransferase-like n=1 Tax=Frieseomelitta varia TaxID=561572 RepID=UPI001CB696DF|nr:peroxisomal carnitine O-octanoyltransferase-like [Frieseomelitta varia]
MTSIILDKWCPSAYRAHGSSYLSCRNVSNVAKEATLPTLPVPDLESTLQKYLAQVEVIAPNHLPKTRSLVKAFLSGPGPKLQQRLLERRQKMTNWDFSLRCCLRHKFRNV